MVPFVNHRRADMTDTSSPPTAQPVTGEVKPDAGRPLRADAQRNRALILEAAEAVLATRGVDASIDEIAQRAGVGVGTVYRNFPNKDALLKALVLSRLEPVVEAAREATTAEDPGEAFTAFLHRLAQEFDSFKALADTIAASGLDLKAIKQEVTGELDELIGQLLARAQAAGSVRPDVSLSDVAALLAGLGHADTSSWDPAQRSRCVALVCDALLVNARIIVPRSAAPAARRDGPAPPQGSSA